MTDESDIPERDKAVNILEQAGGQTYLRADEAIKYLLAFADGADDEFIIEMVDHADEELIEDEDEREHSAKLAMSEALADEQRASRDARGISAVYPHVQLVTYSDVSAIIVRALGAEPSDFTAGGHGFTADGRHDRDMKTIKNDFENAVEP